MQMEMNHKEIAPGTEVIALSGKLMMGPESEKIVTLVEDLVKQGRRTVIFDMSGVWRSTARASDGSSRAITSSAR